MVWHPWRFSFPLIPTDLLLAIGGGCRVGRPRRFFAKQGAPPSLWHGMVRLSGGRASPVSCSIINCLEMRAGASGSGTSTTKRGEKSKGIHSACPIPTLKATVALLVAAAEGEECEALDGTNMALLAGSVLIVEMEQPEGGSISIIILQSDRMVEASLVLEDDLATIQFNVDSTRELGYQHPLVEGDNIFVIQYLLDAHPGEAVTSLRFVHCYWSANLVRIAVLWR